MAKLGALSTELVLMIAEFSTPLAALNLALTCKEKWKQCANVLQEHARLSKQYWELRLNPLNPHVQRGNLEEAWRRSAWGVFHSICNDPRIAYHVKRLTNGDFDTYEGEFEPSDAQRTACHHAAERSAALSGIDRDAVAKAIDSEDDSRLCCILMQMCPDISHLQFVDFYSTDYNYVGDFLARAAEYPQQVRAGTLRKLRSAVLQHGDTEGSIAIDFVVSVALLPSVQSIDGNMVGPSRDEGRLHLRTAPRLPVSNLTSLVLGYSSIGTPSFLALLPQVKALEKFVYVEGGAIVSFDSMPDLCALVALLAKYQGHSLRDLTISDQDGASRSGLDDRDLMPFPGFRAFEKLARLRVPRLMFFIRRDAKRLKTMLREATEGQLNQGRVNDSTANGHSVQEHSSANDGGEDGEGAENSEGEMGDEDEEDDDDDEDDGYYYDLEPDEVAEIGGELPESLERLELEWQDYTPLDTIYDILKRLVLEKERHHPQLRHIAIPAVGYGITQPISGGWTRIEEGAKAAAEAQQEESRLAFSKACEEHGVSFYRGWSASH